MPTIFFDMDGTIANLYGKENWLEYLENEDATLYAEAEPLLNMQALAHRLNNLQKKGFRLEIISWTSKTGSENFNAEVEAVKIKWLASHLSSVTFDKINIVPYGTLKDNFRKTFDDILFDDEQKNRENWQGFAFDEKDIPKILKVLSL